MSHRFTLEFLQSGTQYEGIITSGEEIIAGLSKSSDINLKKYVEGDNEVDVKTISRSHFMISSTENSIFITDLRSRNGTEVNGKKLVPYNKYLLRNEDAIRLARRNKFTLIFCTPIHEGTDAPELEEEGFSVDIDRQDDFFYIEGNKVFNMNEIEFELFNYLYENANKVCSYSDIAQHVWGGAGVNNNTITRVIRRLRKKMDQVSAGSGRRYIKTVVGRGYLLNRE